MAVSCQLDQCSRRSVITGVLAVAGWRILDDAFPAQAAEELVEFTGDGFSFLHPADWIEKNKAGANLLFVDPAKSSNTIGVVVNPVRIKSLEEFGTLEDTTKQILAAEERKESTNSVTLLSQSAGMSPTGVQQYTVQYLLDSSRGVKYTFTRVGVANQRLYILNIIFLKEFAEANPGYYETLEQALASFQVNQ